METKEEHIISELFQLGMYWRIAYGSLRIILGSALLKVVGVPFTEILYKLMQHEITEDSSDVLFQLAHSFFQAHPFSVTYFLAFYLIFWGCIDIGLSIYLLRHKLWAFPVSLVLIAFFIFYEIYRYFHTHSFVLLMIITVDIGIFWLIRREYSKTIKVTGQA